MNNISGNLQSPVLQSLVELLAISNLVQSQLKTRDLGTTTLTQLNFDFMYPFLEEEQKADADTLKNTSVELNELDIYSIEIVSALYGVWDDTGSPGICNSHRNILCITRSHTNNGNEQKLTQQ